MKILILFFVLFLPQFGLTDSFFVKDPKLVGTSPDEGEAFKILITSTITKDGDHSVVTDPSKADYILTPKMVKTGAAHIIVLDKEKAEKIVFSESTKLSKAEEMDLVAGTITRAVIKERPILTEEKVTDVDSTSESLGVKRRSTLKRWIAGFGYATVSNAEDNQSRLGWNLGVDFEIPTSNAAIRAFIAGCESFNHYGIGAGWFFNDRDSSPFLRGSLGYGGADYKTSRDLLGLKTGETTRGFVVGAATGYRFFRLSKVNLEVSLDYAYMMATNSDSSHPSMTNLLLSLIW